MQPLNPANREVQTKAERKRIPMSVPVQKLAAPDIPGYHLHWFNNDPARIQRAQEGGYEFVDAKEIALGSMSLGSESAVSGNTDLGSQVSVVAGQKVGPDGQAARLVLMKIKEEWWLEDQALIEQRNGQVVTALTEGVVGSEKDKPGETRLRYVGSRTSLPDFFKKKVAK